MVAAVDVRRLQPCSGSSRSQGHAVVRQSPACSGSGISLVTCAVLHSLLDVACSAVAYNFCIGAANRFPASDMCDT